MGAIADELADSIVITNDNPRFESAEAIAEQIKAGISHVAKLTVMLDRGQAIQQTIASAAKNDIILVAGKGHEEYQQIQNEKIAFSDVAQVKDALNASVLSEEGGHGCKP
jgi:UDP-N-acetylmuramoyl-L-alanyl-D-glutamate--2,6-diaminopimelate ligase